MRRHQEVHPEGEPRRRSYRLAILLSIFAVLVVLLPVAEAAAAPSLKVNVTGAGEGEIVSEAEEFFFFEPTPPVACTSADGTCMAEPALVGENEEEPFYGVHLHAKFAPGSEFAGWTIQKGKPFVDFGGFSRCPEPAEPLGCEFESATEGAEELEVTAEFVPAPPGGPVALTVNETGTGTGTMEVECEEGTGFEVCSKPITELEAGTEVQVTATPDGGSTLASLSGTGSAAGCTASPCTFTITEDSEVTVEFNIVAPPGEQPLIIEVVGEGEVTGTEITCTEGATATECEEEVTEGTKASLTATAEAGSHFVGWTTIEGAAGTCTGSTATCEAGPITAGPTKLKATFAATGEGKSVVIGTATAGECPTGGITVEVEGEPSTKRAVCNGTNGSTGPAGPTGPAGSQGLEGPRGPTGVQGVQGAPGATGAMGAAGAKGDTGSQGPAGATGPQGPAGPKGTVSCKVQQKSGGTKVTCTVKYKGAKASGSSVSWRLTRGDRIVRRGTSAGSKLDLGHLASGKYRLHIKGQKGSVLVRVR